MNPCRCSGRRPRPTTASRPTSGPSRGTTNGGFPTGRRCEDSRVRVPDVEYARSGGVAIAYQVIGDASHDVVWIRGDINDMLSSWDRPEFVERVTKLTPIARVLLFDKRGTGLSDYVRDLTSLEAQMDDVR